MAIEAGDLILIAFLSGIGSSVGQPIGRAIYEWLERKLKNTVKTYYENFVM